MGCAIEIVKYLVFIFNLVFSLIGVALLVIGVYFHFNMYSLGVEEAAPMYLIAVGAVVFIISFFGCVGAIRGNSCMLKTYAALLIVLLIVQIAIGTYDFIALKDVKSVQKEVKDNVQEMFDNYNATINARDEMDNLQQLLGCCGVHGPEDWLKNIPMSCCQFPEESPKNVCTISSNTLSTEGCAKRGTSLMIYILRAIGYVLFATGVWELLGIFGAFCLINSLKNQYRRGVYA